MASAPRQLLVTAALGAGLSLIVTGHVSGFGNNLYHLGILAALWTEPQFTQDAYIQSLPHFASGFWWLLAGRVSGDAHQPLFLLLAYLSRCASFLGFLLCADLVGIRTLPQRVTFVLLLTFASTMRLLSPAGGGGLFLNVFTHSEIANGVTLILLAFAARGRLTAAFALNGAVFFLNAFMAVWNALPLGLIMIGLVRRREVASRIVLRRALLGLLPFSALAAPVVSLVLNNPTYGRPVPYDYTTFLYAFYPDHFLVGSISGPSLLFLLASVIIGALAAAQLPRAFCLEALIGFGMVWAVGAVLPLLTHAAPILNLHLLRASGSIQLMVTLATVSLTTLWLTRGARWGAWPWGLVAAAALTTSKLALPLLLAPLWAARGRRAAPPRLERVRLDLLALPLLLASWLAIAVGNERANAAIRADIAKWRDLGTWARSRPAPRSRG
ncbi:hypothetical protein, partial [Methylobacterium soli]|uniref:hypothetical protein n=1 Tax=Methylobacterium soli TaxID=553447 RepID=UPI001EE290BC